MTCRTSVKKVPNKVGEVLALVLAARERLNELEAETWTILAVYETLVLMLGENGHCSGSIVCEYQTICWQKSIADNVVSG